MTGKRQGYMTCLLLLLAYAVIWGFLLKAKFNHFGYFDWDLAFFTQAAWNLLHGSQFSSVVGINYFGDHGYFITLLYLPLLKMFPSALTLVFLKLACFVVSAFVLWSIACRHLTFLAAFLIMLGYLILPANVFTILYDFNPESVAVLIIMLMINSFDLRQWKMFWIWSVLLLLVKENFALLVMTFACFGYLTCDQINRQRGRFIALIFLSTIIFLIEVFVLIPYWRGLTHHAFIVRYAYLGDSLPAMLQNAVMHPNLIVDKLMAPSSLRFIVEVFGPWLLLAFLGPPYLLIPILLLLQHLLSTHPPEQSLYYHYGMTFTPFLMMAVIMALKRINKFFTPFVMHVILIIFALAAFYFTMSFERKFYERAIYPVFQDSSCQDKLMSQVGDDEGVIATFNFLAPLATRQHLYSFHKVFDSFYQDDAYIKKSELNTKQRFVVPDNVNVALIDYDDSWILAYQRFNSDLINKRVENFLSNGWILKDKCGSVNLYRR